jgi:hypothetical protein
VSSVQQKSQPGRPEQPYKLEIWPERQQLPGQPLELPLELPPELPLELPLELPPELPLELPLELPPELPLELPPELPPELLLELLLERHQRKNNS